MKIFLLLLPLILVSCFQEEKIYTLNPDGSGKIQYKATFPLDSAINFNSDEKPTPEQKTKDAVGKIIKESEGIAAWSDIAYKLNDEGKIEFQGTAYFHDINKVKLKMGSITSDSLRPNLSKKNGVVTIKCPLSQEKKTQKNKAKWSEMTPKQQKLAMAKARQGLKQMKGMLAGIAGDMSTKVTIHLPATAKKTTGFKKLSNSSVTITQTGEMMLQGIDKVLADEKIMQTLAADGDMQNEPPAEVMHQMFGFSKDPSASFPASAAPAFNYKKELLAAQKATPAMMKKLGLSPETASPMGAGESKFKSVRLAGLRIVTPSADSKVRPFNWSAGTTIAVIAELPGAVISAVDGKI